MNLNNMATMGEKAMSDSAFIQFKGVSVLVQGGIVLLALYFSGKTKPPLQYGLYALTAWQTYGLVRLATLKNEKASQ